MDLFSGVGVALVTLLDDTGSVDAAATGSLAADLAGRGMKAVLACGTTGEAGALTDVERVDVIRAVRDALPPDIQVLAGTGATDPAHAAELTRAAVGPAPTRSWPGRRPAATTWPATSQLWATPPTGRPVLGYHIPWISSPGIPVSELAGLPIAGLKDSSGDPDRLLAEVARYSGRTYVGLVGPAGPGRPAGRRRRDPGRGQRRAGTVHRGLRRRRQGPGPANRRPPRRARGRRARSLKQFLADRSAAPSP